MKPKEIVLMLIPLTVVMITFGILACGGDKTPNVYTFPNTHPLTEDYWYAYIEGVSDTVRIFRVWMIDPDIGISLYGNGRIVPIPAPVIPPDSLGGNERGE